MAKSAFQIRMDYSNAIHQADSLSQTAQELRNAAQKNFQECISDISHNWTGENAQAYINKCRRLQERIAATAEQLERISDTIRKIAGNTYNAEMEALRIARIRKY